jgi:hypothetical protein
MKWILFADDSPIDFWAYWNRPGSAVFEMITLFGIILIVVLMVFFWVVFVRAPRGRKPRHNDKDDSTKGSGHRRKRRRSLFQVLRHHNHRHHGRSRSTNPTLADLDDMPATRQEQPPPT